MNIDRRNIPYARIRFSAPLALLTLLALLAAGCKDEVVPAKGAKERVLTVVARVIDPVTGVSTGPAVDAEITITQVNANGEEVLAQLRTNDQGVAEYRAVFPAAGVNLRVAGVYRNERQYSDPPVFLFCADAKFTLSFVGTPLVCCPRDTLVTYRFLDESGSTDLLRNKPTGISEYTLTRTLFVLDCADPNQTLSIAIPVAKTPFGIKQVRVNDRVVTGSPVVLKKGEALTVVFTVSTATPGDFELPLDFQLTCSDGTPVRYTVRLLATVIEFQCTCPRDSVLSIEPDANTVEVGTVRDYANILVYQNPADCRAIRVDSIVSRDRDRFWDVIAPTPGTIVDAGRDLAITARFRPWRAGNAVDTFLVFIRLADDTPCRITVRLQGFACRTMCPLVVKPVVQQFTASKPIAVDFSAGNSPVPFSPNEGCGGTRTTVTQEITLLLPDTACCPAPASVQIALIDSDPQRVNSRFFDVTPGANVTLGRNTRTTVTLRFTAPTVSEFEQIFASGLRARTGSISDSIFSVSIRLSNSSCGDCQQLVTVRAVVGTFIRISNVITLYAYGQNTPKLPDPPVRKVCHIDCCSQFDGTLDIGRLFNMIDPQTKTFPYPPNQHDFFVEVADTSSTRTPPQDPMLFRTAGTDFTKLLLFAQNYLERDFANVKRIVGDVQNALNANGAYFLQPSLPWTFPPGPTPVRPRPGDVYIISTQGQWTSGSTSHVIPCGVALLYVRKIFLGNEPNSFNDQTGIEYELIYPVILY